MKIEKLEKNPKNFDLECTTVWSFPKRGKWATHNGDYRGNWAPEIPRNLILRYSEKGDVVLDPFVGSGTTLIECKILGRDGKGIDINPEAINLSKMRLKFGNGKMTYQELITGDSRNLTKYFNSESIDLICAHPPYWNIIKYTKKTSDLSNIENLDNFIAEMKKVSDACFNVLKKNKYCCVLIGDTRKQKHVIPLGFKIMQTFLDSGFRLKEIIIKQQHNCTTTGFWKKKSKELNFLLLAHEYLFVFRKP